MTATDRAAILDQIERSLDRLLDNRLDLRCTRLVRLRALIGRYTLAAPAVVYRDRPAPLVCLHCGRKHEDTTP